MYKCAYISSMYSHNYNYKSIIVFYILTWNCDAEYECRVERYFCEWLILHGLSYKTFIYGLNFIIHSLSYACSHNGMTANSKIKAYHTFWSQEKIQVDFYSAVE